MPSWPVSVDWPTVAPWPDGLPDYRDPRLRGALFRNNHPDGIVQICIHQLRLPITVRRIGLADHECCGALVGTGPGHQAGQ